MKMVELIYYVKQLIDTSQYQLVEFDEYSVLFDKKINKSIAVFAEKFYISSGEKIGVCDIRCNKDAITKFSKLYVLPPFIAKYQEWIGIRLGDDIESEVVYELFDTILQTNSKCNVVLSSDKQNIQHAEYQDTEIDFSTVLNENKIPREIVEMRKLNGFYAQAKFMEHYEDDFSLNRYVKKYYCQYKDLTDMELRGYFSWRTKIRKDIYEPICTSMAYMYIYELINGIGVTSVTEALDKMELFIEKYINEIANDNGMLANLRHWMLDLCIINNIDVGRALHYVDSGMLVFDKSIMVLKEPNKYEKQEVFKALCNFGGNKIKNSILLKKHNDIAIDLFTYVWRYMLKNYKGDIFEECFGEQVLNFWVPLSNAVYCIESNLQDGVYKLTDVRSYIFENNAYYEKSHDNCKIKKIQEILNEIERQIKVYLKIRVSSKTEECNSLIVSCIKAALEEYKIQKEKASKPKIKIDFSGIDRIRSISNETRDILLTNEDLDIEEDEIILKNENMIQSNMDDNIKDYVINILSLLLQGKSIKDELKYKSADMLADCINDFMYEYIGDLTVESDGHELKIIEDNYTEVKKIVGGNIL